MVQLLVLLRNLIRKSRFNGTAKFTSDYEPAETLDEDGFNVVRCLSRSSKLSIVDSKDNVLDELNVPYGANVNVNEGDKVKKDDSFSWDPYYRLNSCKTIWSY